MNLEDAARLVGGSTLCEVRLYLNDENRHRPAAPKRYAEVMYPAATAH